jgi:FkbM family methyltransferase
LAPAVLYIVIYFIFDEHRTLLIALSEISNRNQEQRNSTMISFAQNFEDVLLYRCFRSVATGFYVDVGAFHPKIASVTKLFYDKGWSGINIEPGQGIAALQAARPRDLNLAVAISDHSGEANFYEHPNDPGTSTLSAEVPPVIAERAGTRQLRRVSLLTLTQVLDAHAPTRHLHFLKVDVEGAETAVMAGLNLKRYRPEVILIESTEPYSTIRHPGPWTDILAAAGYRLAYFDGINDFWVREESAERLLPEFAVPVNVLDGFTRPDPRVEALEGEHARAADAARFHAESAATAMALLVAAKAETEATRRTAAAAEAAKVETEATLRTAVAAVAATEASLKQKTAQLAAAEARLAHETTARAEYQARLLRLTETLHLDNAPLALRIVLPLARGIRFFSRLLPRDAESPASPNAPNPTQSALTELDVDFYRSFYTDLSQFSESEARSHYLTYGRKEGRFPNLRARDQSSGALAELDVDFYRSFYPDLSQFSESEARSHYLTYGRKEGRFPNLKASEQSDGLAELPPKQAEEAKRDVNPSVLRDAELSLRLLGSPSSKRGKDQPS